MTPAWVYAETRSNRIPHMRLGRYFRYRRSTIDAWMNELERDSNGDPIVLSATLARGRVTPAGDQRIT